jgi:hypothetical protein
VVQSSFQVGAITLIRTFPPQKINRIVYLFIHASSPLKFILPFIFRCTLLSLGAWSPSRFGFAPDAGHFFYLGIKAAVAQGLVLVQGEP